MIKKTLLILFCIISIAWSPQRTSEKAIELNQLALDLINTKVLLALSAHPDDEDGATLAYYRLKFGVKTYSVFFTRGEGGQNEIGPELYKELGIIRTRETEAAAQILGSRVYFLNFIDFGYSKTATETFQKWGGRTAVLERVVYLIRKLKPDVIITNHNPIDGHGHHQVVAIAAIEAFDAAADPTFASEQLREEGVDLWQAQKLFWRVRTANREPVDVTNGVGQIDTIRRQSYQAIAMMALAEHKSQGMDKFALMREVDPAAKTFYRLIRSSSKFVNDSTNFFGGIEPLRGLSALVGAGGKLREVSQTILKSPAEKESEQLLSFLRAALADTSMKRFMDNLSVLKMGKCSGSYTPLECRTAELWDETIRRIGTLLHDISMKVVVSDSIVVRGQQITIRVPDVSPGKWKGKLSYGIRVPSYWSVQKQDAVFTVTIPWVTTPTLPLVEGIYQSYESSPLVTLLATPRDHPVFVFEVPISLAVAPHQVLSVEPKVTRWREGGNEFQFKVQNYFNNKTAGRIQVELPLGWSSSPAEFVIEKEGEEDKGKVFIFPDRNTPDGDYQVILRAHDATNTVVIRKFSFETSRDAYIGVIKSYDNTLENALEELGSKFKLLDEKDLAGDLSKFTSIMVDIRAYLVREDLKKNNRQLLEYVKSGGNLIVMYHKDFEWKSEFAPYPLKVSRDRVVDETAPIQVLQPDHPLFTWPNKISPSDWEGWVQERGLYFPNDYSKEYIELVSSNDPDEKPLRGGYLLARHGQGTYIYTSYVWYRQWKEVHPGALRNLANMISLPFYREKQ